MPGLKMTKPQSERVHGLVVSFYEKAKTIAEVPGDFCLMLLTVQRMIEDDTSFDQQELDIVVFVLECYFAAFEEHDVDPLAEQAYAKITGYWSEEFDAPWYDRCLEFGHSVGYQEKSSTRDKLGY